MIKPLYITAFLAGMAWMPLKAQNPGCNGTRYLDDVFATVKKTTVTYAPSINHLGQNVNLAIDIYEPEGDQVSSRPVVILAHGGSFVFGDKSMMQSSCELLAKKGYVAASIQYRLFPFFVLGFPDSTEVFDTALKAMGDMKAAVRFFREDAATTNTYRADAAHIFIGGYSAGAVTAMHTAYINEDDQLPTFLQTLLTNNGGLEGISGTASNKGYASYSGAVVNMSGGLYRSFWVEADESPLVSIHGTADATVPYTFGLAANIAFLEGSSLVHEHANEVGLWNNLLTVPGAGHTDLYEQAQWKPFLDSFWVNATTLLEDLTCSTVDAQEPLDAASPWTIFPNPNQGNGFYLQLPAEVAQVDLRIYDMTGKLAHSLSQANAQTMVALNHLPKGVYQVQLIHPDKQFAVKTLIIQ
ncbi:MAG TPA: T9SS type A sorting domain-containing protein [Saprospiraceae bacterium]|nr:T9SS type A sorting domain-containing protein [Saprospiraceae bacterium]